MIAIIADVQTDYAQLQSMAAQSHGRMESMGIGQPHRLSCDYCGLMHDAKDLMPEGLGLFMCTTCRANIDSATRSGIFTFWQLLDFVLLAPAPAASGAPVAVGVCLAPFSGLSHPGERKPWWQDVKFWAGDKRMGDDPPNGLAWCRDEILAWLKKPRASERWTLKP